MSNYSFIIVGKNDNPIYEAEFSSGQKQRDTSNQLSQFIIHSALDVVEETVWKSNTMYMKVVDRYGKLFISSFVTAGHMKFMLLHDKKDEDAIKNFFTDVHELYIKILLNPFYVVNSTITSQAFDVRVKKLAAKYF